MGNSSLRTRNKKDMHYFDGAVFSVCRKTLADARRETRMPCERCGIRTDLSLNGCEKLAREIKGEKSKGSGLIV
jgi:hypothetical protein